MRVSEGSGIYPHPRFRGVPVTSEFPFSAAGRIGAVHGVILCIFMLILIMLSLKQNPMVWLNDAPSAVRERFGPLDDRSRRQRAIWGLVMVLGLTLIFGHLAWSSWDLGLLPTFVAALLCFEIFNLFDALVIDLGLVVVRPRWAFPPGASDDPAYRDATWHLTNWVKGLVAGVPFAGIVLGIAWLVSLVL